MNPVLNYVRLRALARFHCPLLHLKCLQLRDGSRKHPIKDVLVESGEGRSLTLEFDVDDGVVPGLGILVNLHKLFCDKTDVSGCADAGLHKILVRYSKPVLVVDTVDECLSKVSVVEERLEWEIIFRSFDGCESTLNDWENSLSSVDAGRGDAEELVLN